MVVPRVDKTLSGIANGSDSDATSKIAGRYLVESPTHHHSLWRLVRTHAGHLTLEHYAAKDNTLKSTWSIVTQYLYDQFVFVFFIF